MRQEIRNYRSNTHTHLMNIVRTGGQTFECDDKTDFLPGVCCRSFSFDIYFVCSKRGRIDFRAQGATGKKEGKTGTKHNKNKKITRKL